MSVHPSYSFKAGIAFACNTVEIPGVLVSKMLTGVHEGREIFML